MRFALVIVAGTLLAGTVVEDAVAQSLGTVITREAENETKRQAQRRTREAVQCVSGARDCLPEEETKAQGDAPQASATSAAAASQRQPFAVPPIAGASAVDNQAGTLASYRRITGFKPKLISYADHTGLLTRTRYDLTGGQAPSAMIAAWREPLLQQGFQIEWQCSRKAQCGSSSYHQLGAGYVPVNGINLGIAGDVEYFTARRKAEGEPTIYVAVALNRSVAYVDVIEVAP